MGETRQFGLKVVAKEGKGVNVTLTQALLNDILGNVAHIDPLVLIGLNIRPPCQAIQHTLCGPQSMVRWTKHSSKRFHQSLPYAHMTREAQVWLKIAMNFLIPGLHYTDITNDRVYLVCALMTNEVCNEKGPGTPRAQNGCRLSIEEKLGQVEQRYPFKALLSIGPNFYEPMDDDIPIEKDRLWTGSYVDFDSNTKEVDPLQAVEEVEGRYPMED
ncbi:hypothetical protein H5410_027195 [Solanum commersonii]|uniref:Uncharacterized protein n=1 Tax=Solanum commersonii TaxID=4109 RepID=A0A9J5Z1A2_SOLCO|nr:hypothetical protein H5410_027195 [Solanum commersonii]